MPRLTWDVGTAYDLFISLDVLHRPAEFGVRGAWAAGVRARIPAAERRTLEQSRSLGLMPLSWVYTLAEPKDGTAVLRALGQIPAAERLPTLALTPEWPPADMTALLREVAGRGRWDERDRQALDACCESEHPRKRGNKSGCTEESAGVLDAWAHAAEFGERYLAALRAYQEVFYAEEEQRIRPALQAALSRAQALAERLSLPDLLEELSQGLRLEEPSKSGELVLVPSYWCTPLIYFGDLSAECRILLFGARSADASLIPGETVPDALLRSLEALSDPTRLRILHYLTPEALTPAQLARRLRLRVPTVMHHLQTLRLAGLVRVIVGDGKEAKQYAARPEALRASFDSLKGFLESGQAENRNEIQSS
jgi:DNA-binding transcriptional ArsR family regulator